MIKSVMRSFLYKFSFFNRHLFICEVFLNILTIILSLAVCVILMIVIDSDSPRNWVGFSFIVMFVSLPWSLFIEKLNIGDLPYDGSGIILAMNIGVAINIVLYSLGKAYFSFKKTKSSFNDDEDENFR